MKVERWEGRGHVVFYANNHGKTIILSSGELLNEPRLRKLASKRLVEFLLNEPN